MDISKLSTAQLESLLRAAQKEKKRKQKRKPAAKVRQILERAAKAAGYTLFELFGDTTPTSRKSRPSQVARRRSTGASVPPKFRNPADMSQTWTGRGSRPKWLAAALAGGATLDSLRITQNPA